MNGRLPFAQRLAAYSAAAGVALAAAPEAGAQVVYHDIDPDQTVGVGDTVSLDIDDDGTADFTLAGNAGGTATTARFRFRAAAGAPSQNGFLGVDAFSFYPETIGVPDRLSSGAVIGPSTPPHGFYPYGIVASLFQGDPFYNFAGAEGYAGFRFVAGDGELHYGWVRLAVDAGVTQATLFAYAYESRQDRPIAAGATGVAVEAGPDGAPGTHALSDAYPNPTAGRTQLALEVARTQAVRVAVYDALGREVAVLHDGALAAGAARRLTLDGAALPAGVYAVRVVGEDFADTRTLTLLK